MKKWERALVHSGDSIRAAIETIDKGGLQIALVVDDTKRLLGTVTDGDVRRGVLRGSSLDSPVEQIMNTQFRTVSPDTPRAAVRKMMADLSIHQLPVIDAEGRIVGLQLIDSLINIPATTDTWVVIMAGGLGTRLRPITETIPKPMIQIGGRPILESILNGFIAQGFRRFFLAVNYKAEVLRGHFGDGSRLGVSIEYVQEDDRKGTAGALSLLGQRPPGSFLVMNGDLLTTVNFRQLLDFHRQNDAVATMCVREHAYQIPYGVIQTDQHRLVALEEKPVQSVLVNAGIYVLDPRVLDVIPNDRMYDMTDLFEDLMRAGRQAIVFPLREYWLDVGGAEDLERASNEFPKVFE